MLSYPRIIFPFGEYSRIHAKPRFSSVKLFKIYISKKLISNYKTEKNTVFLKQLFVRLQ